MYIKVLLGVKITVKILSFPPEKRRNKSNVIIPQFGGSVKGRLDAGLLYLNYVN